jgi:hypothetical protein
MACAALLSLAPSVFAQRRPEPAGDLADLLGRVGDYVAAYERGVSGIVSEEDYAQVARSAATGMASRKVRADFLLLNVANTWIGFRDVFEVDDKPVRDRQARLNALFTGDAASAIEQAERIAGESARFNLNQSFAVGRTINVPMSALVFFRAENQSRSAFELGGRDSAGGVACRIIRFVEREKPRLLMTNSGDAASGTACVEPASGALLKTELNLSTEISQQQDVDAPQLQSSAHLQPFTGSRSNGRDSTVSVTARIRVTYGSRPDLAMWVPVSMDDHYEILPGSTVIDGHATYANFREFQVETKTIIK